ncbi:glycogen debranching protein GlgX [Endozoicomonas atrinae]|uniref:glycogen debranching protein GlgX n=1 Tax=Endozoicomonas atrinae TaxID=1333660 RepID=UPI0008257D46|nr:glycogen debranching protein GlgX [Endozoicomonas atrinae]
MNQPRITIESFGPGSCHHLGANFLNQQLHPALPASAAGVNFAVYAPEASAMMLCLFDSTGVEQRIPMHGPEKGIWHVLVKGLQEGQAYGYRADGRWAPDEGLRFNINQLLVDPYAREVKGAINWQPAVYDYSGKERNHWLFNDQDNGHLLPKSVVRTDQFDWQSVTRPEISHDDSIIYESHVKGFTRQHPAIPEALRGTYLGMCHPVVIDYLKDLGVNTVELLPVTSFLSEPRLRKLGLKNYWGYNPLCFMAPEPSYAIDDPVDELKTMVRELHRAGIRVVMDVVYNHTCEAGSDGPSLSLRGLAEKDYYLLDHHGGHLVTTNYSGCGNTLNFDCAQTIKLVMDSLRYWAEQYQIDGFRFDLAPTMARRHRQFDAHSAFFQAVFQDPVLSTRQMIAEPWDLGPEGYRLKGFPRDWHEWNDRYRDGIRSFWRGDKDQVVDIAWRLTGSRDLFGRGRPAGSVNYICSHDGFTLHDLVSFEHRHNLANGEGNRDGDQHNLSWNYGVEGASSDPAVQKLRLRARKNLLTTLMFSRSIPMLMAGDEFGNSQHGNNNAYCQDNPIGWVDWSWLAEVSGNNNENPDGAELQKFTSMLIHLRKSEPLLGIRYQTDDSQWHSAVLDWFNTHGIPLTAAMLPDERGHALVMRYRCPVDSQPSLVLLVNNEVETRRFNLPDTGNTVRWQRVLSTDLDNTEAFREEMVLNQGWYEVPGHTVVVVKELI